MARPWASRSPYPLLVGLSDRNAEQRLAITSRARVLKDRPSGSTGGSAPARCPQSSRRCFRAGGTKVIHKAHLTSIRAVLSAASQRSRTRGWGWDFVNSVRACRSGPRAPHAARRNGSRAVLRIGGWWPRGTGQLDRSVTHVCTTTIAIILANCPHRDGDHPVVRDEGAVMPMGSQHSHALAEVQVER